MDDARFDEVSRRLAARRTLLGGLTAAAVALAGPLPELLAKPKKKKKKKPKKCKAGTVRCDKTCVNTGSDPQNCGACGKRCPNGGACAGGACQQPPTTDPCPTGQKRCAGACVDTQTDNRHCGACGATCAVGRCVGGRCIECEDQNGCGGYSGNDLVCRNGRCVCADETKGICTRYQDGRGSCHQCCPGGNGQCRFDEVCFYRDSPSGHYGLCDCPTGWQRCNYNPHPTGTCVEDPMTDPHKCGQFCTDCPASEPGSICCGGLCTRGCSIGSYCPKSQVCGPNCLPCNSDSICCNQGPGTAPRCIPDVNGNGLCYQNI